mmetsp:Transcript_22570/g.33423  ORF Transcript_22570/g.33423 Transcript_22570/m.33423 type:complete len:91 (+) Transcript_22570:116-388(+)
MRHPGPSQPPNESKKSSPPLEKSPKPRPHPAYHGSYSTAAVHPAVAPWSKKCKRLPSTRLSSSFTTQTSTPEKSMKFAKRKIKNIANGSV